MAIDLDDDEVQLLLLALGYATGAAFKNGDSDIARGFVKLLNRIGESRPGYRPYAVSDLTPTKPLPS
jgi:hypothetical protein